ALLTVPANTPNAFGTGTLSLSNGAGLLSIAANGNFINNSVVVRTAFVLSSALTLNGAVNLEYYGAPQITNTAILTFNGVVSGACLNLFGANTAFLNNANTYSGGTYLSLAASGVE